MTVTKSRIFNVLLLTVLILIITSCSGNSDETSSEPTTAPEDSITVTDEPIISNTNTPVPTQRPQATVPPRATLPATWTPTPTSDAEIIETENASNATNIPTIPPQQLLASCNGFGPDFELMTVDFTVGGSPTLAWRDIPEAALYRVRVFDEAGQELKIDFTEQTSIQIEPDVFTQPGRYAWQVEPLDPIGEQICPTRGEALRAIAP